MNEREIEMAEAIFDACQPRNGVKSKDRPFHMWREDTKSHFLGLAKRALEHG